MLNTDILRTYKRYITGALALLFIFYIYRNTQSQWHEFSRLKSLSVKSILISSLLFILLQFVYAIRQQVMLKTLGTKISLKESFHLTNTMMLGNQLPFSAGLISNIVYLRARYGTLISHFVSYVAADTVLKSFMYSGIGLLLISYHGSEWHQFANVVYILLAVLIATIVAFAIPINSRLFQYFKLRWFHAVKDGWGLLKSDSLTLSICIACHFVALVLVSLRFYIIFEALGTEPSLLPLVISAVLVLVIRVASLLPGNVGLRESLIAGSTSQFGISFGSGLTAAIFDRLLCTVLILILGSISASALGVSIAKPNEDIK